MDQVGESGPRIELLLRNIDNNCDPSPTIENFNEIQLSDYFKLFEDFIDVSNGPNDYCLRLTTITATSKRILIRAGSRETEPDLSVSDRYCESKEYLKFTTTSKLGLKLYRRKWNRKLGIKLKRRKLDQPYGYKDTSGCGGKGKFPSLYLNKQSISAIVAAFYKDEHNKNGNMSEPSNEVSTKPRNLHLRS